MLQRRCARIARSRPPPAAVPVGTGRLAAALLGLLLLHPVALRAQPAPASASKPAPAPPASSEENLTVHGQRPRFEAAPMPGAPLGPPPETPTQHDAHLGRYKISGDQSKKDGYDTQTGAYIAPFGSAYTQAGPVADGLASHFEH